MRARFLTRENRFVVRARLPGGAEVRAYLPNTARLTRLLVPDMTLLLAPATAPGRRTGWTVTRVWDGTWVAVDAAGATDLVARHLGAGGRLPGWPSVGRIRREVTHGRHRFDLEVDRVDGVTAIVEVKSLSGAHDRVAGLSGTPSRRGVAHLVALGDLAAGGTPAAVVFVVQRDDVDVLDLAAPADPAWVAAVRGARRAGVHLVAYACEVTEQHRRLGRSLTVRDDLACPPDGSGPAGS